MDYAEIIEFTYKVKNSKPLCELKQHFSTLYNHEKAGLIVATLLFSLVVRTE